MALELGPFSNNASAAKIDLGSIVIPTNVTYFVWAYRNGEGGGSFGRIFGRGAGVHDLISNNPTIANTYGFGNISGSHYYYWTRPDAKKWASISISGNTTDSGTAPTIYQNGVKPTLTKSGTTFWGTLTSLSTHIGNRPSDSARAWDGMLAHFCMWDVNLTDEEHEALHAGALPNTIRPESIVRYYPLLNDERNLFGADGANVSALFSNLNPPVFDLSDTPADVFYSSVAADTSLSTSLQSIAASTSALDTQISLSTAISAVSTSASALTTSVALSLSVVSNSSFTSSLTTSIKLDCSFSSISSITASFLAVSSQFLRPDSNLVQSNWTGGYTDVDESSVNDADFAYSLNNYACQLDMSLSDAEFPIAGTRTVRYRIAKTNAGVLDGAGFDPRITASLWESQKLIAKDSPKIPTGAWTTQTWNPDTSQVSNWNNLRLVFDTEISGASGAYGSAAYKVGGFPGSNEATWTAGSAANYSAALVALHGAEPLPASFVTSEAAYGSTITPIPASDKFFKTVGADTLFLRLLQSHDIYTANANITKAVIAIHGAARDANRIFSNANSLVGGLNNVIVLSPDFLDSASTTPSPESDQLSWGSSWPQGGLSASGPPFRISSHQIIEDLIAHLRSTFTNLNLVHVIGHSAGGQFAQRFAMTNNDPTRVRIMVCNPSSYAYPGNLRWDGSAYTSPGVITCPTYNDWKYGTDNLSSVSYADGIGAANLVNRLGAANVLYLVGENDTDAGDPDLDTTCPANLQGTQRLDRALKYYGYLGQVYTNSIYSTHHLDIVPGSAHSEWRMITSPHARNWVVNEKAPSVPNPLYVKQSLGMLAVDASATSITINCTSTAGNCLVATVALRTDTGRQVGSVTDTAGNTWVKGAHANPGTASSTRTEIWYCVNASAVTSVTVNIVGGAAIRCAALITEYSGVSKAATVISSATKSEASVTSIETNPAYVFTRGALLLSSANSSTFGDRRTIDGASGFTALKDYSAPSSSVDTRGVGLSWVEFEVPSASINAVTSAQSSLTSGITTGIRFISSIGSASSVSSSLTTSIQMDSGLYSQSSISATFAGSVAQLQSSLSTQATATSNLSTAIALSSSLTNLASLTAALSGNAAQLQSSITSQSLLSSNLTTQITLLSSLTGQSIVAATFAGSAAQLQSNLQATVGLTSDLSTQIPLSTSLAAQSVVSAAVTINTSLATSAVASSLLIAGIITQVRFNAALQSQSLLAALIDGAPIDAPVGSGYIPSMVKSSRPVTHGRPSRIISSSRARPIYN